MEDQWIAAPPCTLLTDSNASSSGGYMDVEHSCTSDSGVQLLDSESTDMNVSAVGLDDVSSPIKEEEVAPSEQGSGWTQSDIDNSNIPGETKETFDEEAITELDSLPVTSTTHNEAMISSQCSTFDPNEEPVVCRRRPKRVAATNPTPKRVSFHEDILKNTKTDNIHIEHGFITYKNGVRQPSAVAAAALAGRYSWCAKGSAGGGEFQMAADDPEYVIYRNACSEVLDYGKTDIYDGDGEPPKCDNSGVFEYADSQNNITSGAGGGRLYQCHCSDSNSSLESNGNAAVMDMNSNQVRANYAQTKSSSCDCIGQQQQNKSQKDAAEQVLTDNCYYSEPNIDTMRGASVWNREKKPKSSCLKKTSYASFDSNNLQTQEAVTNSLQKFNIHRKRNSRQEKTTTTTSTHLASGRLLDNGKSIFGSLKNIFSMPLAERGVPEGQEDAQAVHEEEDEQMVDNRDATYDDDITENVTRQLSPDLSPTEPSPNSRSRTFLSKSFDGGFHEKLSSPNKKKFIHTVDEQLRKKTSAGDERGSPKKTIVAAVTPPPAAPQKSEVYRNKFIVNCESTVFEHTGVSYEGAEPSPIEGPTAAEPVENASQSFLTQKISKWTNMFRSNTKENKNQTNAPPPAIPSPNRVSLLKTEVRQNQPVKEEFSGLLPSGGNSAMANDVMECSFASSSSTMTDVSSILSSGGGTPTTATGTVSASTTEGITNNTSASGDGFHQIFASSPNRTPTRHLPSPRRRKGSSNHRMSPDLFNNYVQLMGNRAPVNDLRTSSLLSEDFDDILTVTTTDTMTSGTSSVGHQDDLVIVDYPEITIPDHPDDSDFLKPASTKTSLINRFLRNVTQKKIMEATVALNRKLVAGGATAAIGRPVVGSLYVRGVRPMNKDLIEDLNAEIAMEIEQNKVGGENNKQMPHCETHSPVKSTEDDSDVLGLGFGVGEIPVAKFQGMQFPFIGVVVPEFLMKVFKLFIGYDREGIMTPVLVFLTNKTLYVTDLVRSTLCNKFVMPYAELDVILVGPSGNTVLLCNGARDMQQVLLAGGPNQANALVASLEICARRGGLQLPSIGQLSLGHLAPLQHFVRENSKTVDQREKWLYYAVVSISPMTSSEGFTEVEEQLGANINGPLMHRSMSKTGMAMGQWSASYFLLKAGVLYMFPTTGSGGNHQNQTQRLPSWAVTLTECQGVRRMMNAGRPHCFELLLKTGALQLAASDEYSASDWMQALVQSASGLFELEEKRSHYGCTLVLTSSHIITLREDFNEPLKRQQQGGKSGQRDVKSVAPPTAMVMPEESASSRGSSVVSTPNRVGGTIRRKSSGEPVNSIMAGKPKEATAATQGGYNKMFSEYGKESGMEILSCADIGQLLSVKVSEKASIWWCSLEFSCQECVQENSDVVVHFATDSEHRRFLEKLEEVWRARTKEKEFPLQQVVENGDSMAEHCTKLFMDINRVWDPLVTAALGYPK